MYKLKMSEKHKKKQKRKNLLLVQTILKINLSNKKKINFY